MLTICFARFQNPAGASHPCPWCTLPREQFCTTAVGEPRTLGSIRRNTERWRAACRERGRTLPASQFDNCVEMPLPPGDDNTPVMELLPPMELHLLLGAVNRLVDHLEKILEESGSRLTVQQWTGTLGLARSSYHGGQFEGNGCRRLLRGADTLQRLAEEASAFEAIPVVSALRALRAVVEACFGATVSGDVAEKVAAYREAYLQLQIPVTTKNHAIFSHVTDFCQQHGRGLGPYSEQASESVHADFRLCWEKYKVGPANSQYVPQLLRAVQAYNCRHL